MYHDPLPRRSLIAGGLLVTVLLLSVLLFAFRPHQTIERVLFFPDETDDTWRGEIREIPVQSARETEIAYVLRELVLGPTRLQYGRALPRATRIRSVIYRDGRLYVDFSAAVVLEAGSVGVDFAEMLSGVRKTLEYNYPMIEEIVFTVAGALPKQNS